ncbi:MAG: sigma-70 family RNA polymerase sigma factor [Bacteroidota bacterium]
MPTPADRKETVTALLSAWTSGEQDAANALMPLVYDELHRLAHRQLRRERSDHTLNTTALVHEAYFKLVRIDRIAWQGRAHFLALAATAMRQVLINYAERRSAQKRGGSQTPRSLDGLAVPNPEQDASLDDLLALDTALTQLEALDARQARVVECRFFGGMTVEETAEALGISPATVKRDWTLSRAWLNRELSR